MTTTDHRPWRSPAPARSLRSSSAGPSASWCPASRGPCAAHRDGLLVPACGARARLTEDSLPRRGGVEPGADARTIARLLEEEREDSSVPRAPLADLALSGSTTRTLTDDDREERSLAVAIATRTTTAIASTDRGRAHCRHRDARDLRTTRRRGHARRMAHAHAEGGPRPHRRPARPGRRDRRLMGSCLLCLRTASVTSCASCALVRSRDERLMARVVAGRVPRELPARRWHRLPAHHRPDPRDPRSRPAPGPLREDRAGASAPRPRGGRADPLRPRRGRARGKAMSQRRCATRSLLRTGSRHRRGRGPRAAAPRERRRPVLTPMGLSDTPALYDGIHPLPGQMACDLAAAEPVWHCVLADPATADSRCPPSATAPPPTRWSICGSRTRAAPPPAARTPPPTTPRTTTSSSPRRSRPRRN